MATAHRYQDLICWQLAEAFHDRIVEMVRGTPSASRDYRFRDQILDSASGISKNITEGFLRKSPLVFANFLDYALGSLGEAETWLRDGIVRNYFTAADCAPAFLLARRCLTAMIRLKQSQLRYAARQRHATRPRRRPPGT